MTFIKKYIEEEISNFDKSTLETKDHLSPDIWENGSLRGEIKNSLLKIARDFFESLDVDVEIEDIIMTGSLANYNWSEYSDVDVHIIVDFPDVDENYELVKGFFDAKKNIWNRTHKILIKGFEVEVYVQDLSEPHISTGIYSIMKNQWLIKPKKQITDINWDDISLKVQSFIDQVDDLKEVFEEEKYEESHLYALRLMERLKKLRRAGLEDGGEFSVENLTFKVLRRTEKIGDIVDIKNTSYDKARSIDGASAFVDKPDAVSGTGPPEY